MSTDIFTSNGTFNRAAVKAITVKCCGAAGGGGSSLLGTAGGGGGGGGGFGQKDLIITSDISYSIIVGVGGTGGSDGANGGDSYFDDGTLVRAYGGAGGKYGGNGAFGGAGGGGIGTTTYTGGNGADGSFSSIASAGGGGGGGANDSSNGVDANLNSAGGNGGDGGFAGAGNTGGDATSSMAGGGGGGGGQDIDIGDGGGAAGGHGQVTIDYTAGYLSFDTQPTNTLHSHIIPSFQIKIYFGDDNTLDTNYNGNVTVAIDTNPAGGTLSGTTTVAAVNGVATFSNLSINNAGVGYTFRATATDLTDVISNTFDIILTQFGESSIIAVAKIFNRTGVPQQGISSISAIAKISNKTPIIWENNSSIISTSEIKNRFTGNLKNKNYINTSVLVSDKCKITLKSKSYINNLSNINDKYSRTININSSIKNLANLYNKSNIVIKSKNGCSSIFKLFDFAVTHTTVLNIINFYIAGPISVPSGIDLYQSGIGTQNGNLNLFTKSSSVQGSGIGSLLLNTFSTDNPGIFSTVPLIVGYSNGTPNLLHSLNLFEQGPTSSTKVGAMNLFLENDNSSTVELPLFLANNNISYSGDIPLYLAAPSGTEGAIPESGSFNLFIARNSESIAGGLSLYTKQFDQTNNNINLSVSGGGNLLNFHISFYTRGFDGVNYSGLNFNMDGF